MIDEVQFLCGDRSLLRHFRVRGRYSKNAWDTALVVLLAYEHPPCIVLAWTRSVRRGRLNETERQTRVTK